MIYKRLLSLVLCACMLMGMFAFVSPKTAYAASADAFFNDSVFLGDSITVGLEEYVERKRESDSDFLGDAQFLAKGSYSIRGALNEDGYDLHPILSGKRLQPQKSIAKLGVSRVFIMMGINDVKEDMDNTIDYYEQLIDRIRDANPGIEIFIESVLPMTARKEDRSISNDRIDSLNSKLKKMCSSLDLTYVNVADAMKDSNGRLRSEYSSDDYVHISNDGYAVLVEALRDFASGKAMTGEVVDCSYLNVREKPSTSSKRLGKIRRGNTVVINEMFVDGIWHEIRYEGKKAYVSVDYVDIGLDDDDFEKGKVIKVSSFVNARSGPGTDNDIVTTIKKGKSVYVVKKYSTDNWYLVKYNDQFMYLRKDFVDLD